MKQWYCTGGDIQYGRTCQDSVALVQRHEHMLETVPGDLGSDPEWGIGIRQYQGRTTAFTDVETLADVFQGQHLRDPETARAEINIELRGTKLVYDGRFVAESSSTSSLVLVLE